MFYSPIVRFILVFEITINCVSVTCQLKEGGQIARKKCLEYETRLQEQLPRLRVVGGVDAKPSEFPHMALLGFGNSSHTKWACGGSLISENFVITATHCVTSEFGKVTIIKLGLHQISASDKSVQTFTVKKTYIHPEYTLVTKYNDISLLELDHPADFTLSVQPACLQTSKELPTKLFTATGWGATDKERPANSDILQKANLSYVPFSQCNKRYNKFNGPNDDWQICADGGGTGQDGCVGDSGGPLQLAQDGNTKNSLYTIIGITSTGQSCGGIPAKYTRISYYVPWIESIVWPN